MATPDELQRFLAATRQPGCARLNPPEPSNSVTAMTGSRIVGYAQLVEGRDGYTLDLITEDPKARQTLMNVAPREGDLTWWGHDNGSDAALAAALGMVAPHRRLLNMSRPLPLEQHLVDDSKRVDVRPFVVGQDEQAWLDVNNAAFAWHQEQGNWDLATLRARMNEPWFDPTGLLLHEREGRLAAFCWTKVHADGVGEIFVIAVHPDFHGLGLGRALTVAGLRSLTSIGSNVAVLYVEADNAAAVHLYQDLGFQTVHVDVAYRRLTSGETS